MTNKAQIGSISHGTLRAEDLLEAFAGELEYLARGNSDNINVDWRKLVEDAATVDLESEDASDLVNDLIDALQAFAPPYCYFGAIEGDGSDFGFWPSLEQIEEVPRINDDAESPGFADQARSLGEDCVFVNDHGNVTVYGGDGSIILELV